MSFPERPTDVSPSVPKEWRARMLTERQKGYDAWLYHYSGNCFSCDYCSAGPPSEADLLPLFRAGEAHPAAKYRDAFRR